jgi:hypothetical protein
MAQSGSLGGLVFLGVKTLCLLLRPLGRDVLTLRRTGLSPPVYRKWLDYVIVENGQDVGRLYEDRHSRPELRWFWAISIYVIPKLGITTSGRAPRLEQAKAQFLTNWRKCGTEPTFS